jgi:hypothetical protein
MRTENRKQIEDDEGEVLDKFQPVAFFDWKDTIGQSLDALDDLLKPHGLEIVNYDGGSDDYMIRVEKRTTG